MAIGLLVFLIAFERNILEKKTHYIFSIWHAVTATISIFIGGLRSPEDIAIIKLILYMGYLPGFAVSILYFYQAISCGIKKKEESQYGLLLNMPGE